MQLSKLLKPFEALRNRLFAKLYLAQTISLLGDAFTWVGLALLAYQFGVERRCRHIGDRFYFTSYWCWWFTV